MLALQALGEARARNGLERIPVDLGEKTGSVAGAGRGPVVVHDAAPLTSEMEADHEENLGLRVPLENGRVRRERDEVGVLVGPIEVV